MKTEIVFENKDILVVYKPAGIATQTSKIGEKDVVSELKNYLKGGFVGVVHRLDQPVEGLLVFAKNSATAANLSKQVQAKASDGDEAAFCKDYLAVVMGEPDKSSGRLENMMIKTADRTAQIVDGEDDKRAILKYEKIDTIVKGEYKLSLLRIHLETGRFHQIRAQLAHIGCPIIGDKKYGNTESIACTNDLKIRYVALCADRLIFNMAEGAGKGKTQIHDKNDCICEYTHRPAGSLFNEFDKFADN